MKKRLCQPKEVKKGAKAKNRQNLLTNPVKTVIIIVVAFEKAESEVVRVILDMRPMLRGEVDRIAIDFSLTPRLPEGVEPLGDARVTGEITDSAGYMRLTLCASLGFRGFCARCLDTVENTFTVELERTVATEDTLTEAQLEENVDEYAVVRAGLLDLDELIGEEIFLTFPMRILCKDDCPGLCPKCGKPLKLGNCGCVTREIDPRWAVLANHKWADDEPDKT